MWENITKWTAAIAGGVAGLLGEWSVMLTLLALAMGIDYISGVIVAACGKSPKSEGGGISSNVGFRGLARKGIMMLIVLLATILDSVLGMDAMIFQTATTAYYLANEGISILENAALMGVPFPERVKNALEELKNKNDSGES